MMNRFDNLFGEREPIPTDDVDELLIIAQALPKIPVDDPRVKEFLETGKVQYTHQFGNNFYLLWLSLKNPNPGSGIWETYGKRATEVPEWDEFITTNADAILNVSQVLEEVYEPLQKVSTRLLDYINNGQFDVYERFRNELDHPLGFNAAEHFVWDHMNAALSKVGGRMELSGIDPSQFYG